MLSAAFDIIHSIEGGGAPSNGTDSDNGNETACTLVWNETTNTSDYRPREKCQHQGTSVRVCVSVSVCVCVCVSGNATEMTQCSILRSQCSAGMYFSCYYI